MSMFGWQEHIKEIESGTFFCPSCMRDAPYELIEGRNWFKIFFVPVFPESRPLRHVRCQRCQTRFDERVLAVVTSPELEQETAEDRLAGDWPPGSRVLAVWPVEQIYWYPATVKRSTTRWVEVNYDDGHKARIRSDEVSAIDIAVGSRVFARFQGGSLYYPGEVAWIEGEKVRIAYDDGRTETTTISVIRVLRGPGSNINWQYGDRVLAPWDGPFFYPGTITQIEDDRITVEYDDGDTTIVPAALLRPLDLCEGDPVYCRWKGGPAYYHAIIEEKGGEEIFVKYDDGRAEHSTIQMVRVIPQELKR